MSYLHQRSLPVSSWQRTLFYINPVAGSGRALMVWRSLCRSDPKLEAAVCVAAADPVEAQRQVGEALDTGTLERVVAVGGDGTVHTVANLLLARPERVALGWVPSGTGSDLARTLGLPRNPKRALRAVVERPARPIDVLAVRGGSGVERHVLNIASAGISGAVATAVNALERRNSASYLGATVRALWHYRPVPCRVLVDGEPFYDGEFFVVAVGNGQYFGKGMRVTPRARVDDGLADVVAVPVVPRWQLPVRLPQFLLGRHLNLPIVRYARARHVRLEPENGFPPLELDGETLPAQPADLEVLPGVLEFHY